MPEPDTWEFSRPKATFESGHCSHLQQKENWARWAPLHPLLNNFAQGVTGEGSTDLQKVNNEGE